MSTDLIVSAVPASRLERFRELVEDYWWELMRTASSMKDEASRSAYFGERFCWNGDREPPYWATVNDSPIAFVHFSTDRDRATVSDFYVGPEFRRQGVGGRLVSWTLDYLDEQGITQIDLGARRDNPGSLAFWESQGFTIGHYQLTMFRDPASRTAYPGALSSDFPEDELPYEPWSSRD